MFGPGSEPKNGSSPLRVTPTPLLIWSRSTVPPRKVEGWDAGRQTDGDTEWVRLAGHR